MSKIYEIRIHKYTYTNYKISAMNIKYYKFSSIFDITEFYNGQLYTNVEAIHSMI
jgi:archaellum component FlaF (FlaF/FlaG flagellin family)